MLKSNRIENTIKYTRKIQDRLIAFKIGKLTYLSHSLHTQYHDRLCSFA